MSIKMDKIHAIPYIYNTEGPRFLSVVSGGKSIKEKKVFSTTVEKTEVNPYKTFTSIKTQRIVFHITQKTR